MKYIYFFLLLIKTKTLHINILYEKIVDPNMEALYKDIINSLIRRYNEFLDPAGIQIALQNAFSYNVFSQIPDYKDLQKFGGSDNLTDRMSVLAKMNKNILLIASSESEQRDVHYNLDNPCITKYITTFSNNESISIDTISSINSAIEKYLSQLLGFQVPKLFGIVNLGEIRNFTKNLKRNNFSEKIIACLRKTEVENKNVDFINEIEEIEKSIPENFDNYYEQNDVGDDLLKEKKTILTENRSLKNKPDFLEDSNLFNIQPKTKQPAKNFRKKPQHLKRRKTKTNRKK